MSGQGRSHGFTNSMSWNMFLSNQVGLTSNYTTTTIFAFIESFFWRAIPVYTSEVLVLNQAYVIVLVMVDLLDLY